jgi:hypothetical protein
MLDERPDLAVRTRCPWPDNNQELHMYALLGLATFVAIIELIAIFGWGADSRDGRDWQATGRRS